MTNKVLNSSLNLAAANGEIDWWIFLVAGLAALIVVFIVVMVVCRKISAAKKASESPETVSDEQPEATDKPVEEPVKELEPAAETDEPAVEAEEALLAEEPVDETEEEPAETDEPVEEAVAETVTEENSVTEAVAETTEEIADDDADDEEERESETVVKIVDGIGIIVRYNKSFTARLIQSPDEVKERYTALKNELLAYGKAKSRISWNFDSFNAGRNKLAKLNVNGKTLKLFLALNPDDYADSKYKVERNESKRYEDVPCLYRITNPRRLTYAAELIAAVAQKYGLVKGETPTENYYRPYETTDALVEKGLIKELISKADYDEYMRKMSQAEVDKKRREFVSAAEVNAIIADDVVVTLIEDARGTKTYSGGKKGIINIDTLSANFEAGDTVNIDALKGKGLIPKNVGYVKVLARGSLNKPLKVEMQDFSIEAVKMIVLTGGKAKRV